MKNLKEITNEKQQGYQKLFDEACKKREAYKVKNNWKNLSFDEKVELSKKYNKFFDPVWKAEKKYLKAQLNYINSTEYLNGEYKKDSRKYQKTIANIDSSLKKIKDLVYKQKSKSKNMEIFNGKETILFGTPKQILSYFTNAKIAYSKIPSKYIYKDVEILYSREYFCLDLGNARNKFVII